MQPIPAIYSPRIDRITVGIPGRFLALAISAACLAVMIIAVRLIPSPTGMGTHLQLGMEPCYFALRTGIPCPSCGMTTSYSWLARGNFPASFYVQPMGAMLGIATIVIFWAALYIACTGRSIFRLIALGPTRYYVPSIVGLAIAAWAWKIFIHLHGIDGWG